MQIETIDLSKIKLDKQNARKHSDRSIEAIADSLQQFGQQKPIVIGKDNTVVAGNGTVQAATKLGWKKITAVRIPADWTKKQVQAFAIADNRTAELSDWDIEHLLPQLESFTDDMLTQVGFSKEELEDLLEFRDNPFQTVRENVADLKPHPRNYQKHPDDQLDHIIKSIETHGFYRNIVVAQDNTILAGHGVAEAVKKMGRKRVPVIRLPIAPDDPRALKVLTSDNEINNLAEVDDRALTEMLKEILHSNQDGLDGTGFNPEQLGALAMITRFEHEIADKNAANEWVGMPDFEPAKGRVELMVHFESEELREQFIKEKNLDIAKRGKEVWSTWWPYMGRDDVSSLRVVADD